MVSSQGPCRPGPIPPQMSPLASGIVITLSFVFFASRKTFAASRDDDIAEPYQEDIDADASLLPSLLRYR